MLFYGAADKFYNKQQDGDDDANGRSFEDKRNPKWFECPFRLDKDVDNDCNLFYYHFFNTKAEELVRKEYYSGTEGTEEEDHSTATKGATTRGRKKRNGTVIVDSANKEFNKQQKRGKKLKIKFISEYLTEHYTKYQD